VKRVCVIDGHGGGIGTALIRCLKEACGESIELIALGTNAIAASQMLKAGANRAASGENAIVRTTQTVDVIIGQQKTVKAQLKRMNLVNHRIVFGS